jgi:hypothetical protein
MDRKRIEIAVIVDIVDGLEGASDGKGLEFVDVQFLDGSADRFWRIGPVGGRTGWAGTAAGAGAAAGLGRCLGVQVTVSPENETSG